MFVIESVPSPFGSPFAKEWDYRETRLAITDNQRVVVYDERSAKEVVTFLNANREKRH